MKLLAALIAPFALGGLLVLTTPAPVAACGSALACWNAARTGTVITGWLSARGALASIRPPLASPH